LLVLRGAEKKTFAFLPFFFSFFENSRERSQRIYFFFFCLLGKHWATKQTLIALVFSLKKYFKEKLNKSGIRILVMGLVGVEPTAASL